LILAFTGVGFGEFAFEVTGDFLSHAPGAPGAKRVLKV